MMVLTNQRDSQRAARPINNLIAQNVAEEVSNHYHEEIIHE